MTTCFDNPYLLLEVVVFPSAKLLVAVGAHHHSFLLDLASEAIRRSAGCLVWR